MLKPFRAAEAAMRQEAVEANIDAEHAENIKSQQGNNDASPAEKPGNKGQQRQQVKNAYGNRPTPRDAVWFDPRGYRQPRGGQRNSRICKIGGQDVGLITLCSCIGDADPKKAHHHTDPTAAPRSRLCIWRQRSQELATRLPK